MTDCFGIVDICGYKYDSGRAFRLTDKVTFTCDCNLWIDDEFNELEFRDLTSEELEHYMITEKQVMYARAR